ncbi:uncharacterized protein LOC122293794 [Carya illinoinensis]|uniref:uncharacterized protein LOC122293794 n=1 Tax=Carya illinoinensis TaxID=32201 RepID=UPI001C725FCA|nr:uncharacterized protein LOC122293794 [Carya illinoinensis]
MELFGITEARTGLEGRYCDAKVDELIDGRRGVWKEELVKEVFTEDEAKIVCSLPISKSGLPDKQILGYTKDGLFSVKSAYHMEMCRKRREKGEKSEGSWFDWRKLWNLNVPGVVKVFLWKALNDCLPTRNNLKKRKVIEDAYCPICGTEEETVTHALWSCRGLLSLVAKEDLELVAVVMRGVWFRRNAFIFEKKFTGPGTVIEQATVSLENFQMAQTIRKEVRVRPEWGRKGCRWKAPVGDFIKVNWDAGMSVKDGRVGTGVVIRDGNGEVLRAMKLCAKLNFENVIFEGDALAVVKAINGERESWEWYGQLVEDMKGVLKNRKRWSVQHVFKEGNQVAHHLFKVSLSFIEEQIWMECCPPEVQKIVIQENLYTVNS